MVIFNNDKLYNDECYHDDFYNDDFFINLNGDFLQRQFFPMTNFTMTFFIF